MAAIITEMVPKIPPSKYYSAKLTCRSHIGNTIKLIKNKLSSRQLSMFRKTCFGHSLDVQLIFNGPLIHHLLLREIEDDMRPNVISVDLFGNKVSFGQKEFNLITGLKYAIKTVRKDVSPVRLRSMYFKDKVDLQVTQLERMYEEAQFENDEDAVKVSIVYFVELALMGRERSLTVDMSLFRVVDDWDVCCNYDWCTPIFEKTMRSLKRGLKSKKVSKKDELRKTYSLYGFPYAFQVWAYECISTLTGRFACRVNNDVVHVFSGGRAPIHMPITFLRGRSSGPQPVSLELVAMEAETNFLDRVIEAPLLPNPSADGALDGSLPAPVHVEGHVDDGSMVGANSDDVQLPSRKKKKGKKASWQCKFMKRLKNLNKRLGGIEADLKAIRKYLQRLSKGLPVDPSALRKRQGGLENGSLGCNDNIEELAGPEGPARPDHSKEPACEMGNEVADDVLRTPVDDRRRTGHEARLCDICGDAGYADSAFTCCRCGIAHEHVYCMRVLLKNITESWICESCLLGESNLSNNL